MNKDNGLLFKTYFDKHEFERDRDILTDAGIEFWASNRAPSVNFRVPGSAFTEIELHVEAKDIDQVAILLSKDRHGA